MIVPAAVFSSGSSILLMTNGAAYSRRTTFHGVPYQCFRTPTYHVSCTSKNCIRFVVFSLMG